MFIRASDGGTPPQVAYTTVNLIVDRNRASPSWVNLEPGNIARRTVLETIDFSQVIYTVQANDADQTVSFFYSFHSIDGKY